MRPPDRYHASPFYSFVTGTTPHRVPLFSESLRMVWRWLRGDKPSLGQRIAEQRVVDEIASKMEDQDASLPLDPVRKR
jgi:hypothetical protein